MACHRIYPLGNEACKEESKGINRFGVLTLLKGLCKMHQEKKLSIIRGAQKGAHGVKSGGRLCSRTKKRRGGGADLGGGSLNQSSVRSTYYPNPLYL